jgi:hypothetical protein
LSIVPPPIPSSTTGRSDSAGLEDILNAYGQSYALFDLPFTDASSSASDLSQLMTEFTTLF